MTPPHFVYLILMDEEPYVVYGQKSDADTFLARLPEDRRARYWVEEIYCIDRAGWAVVE